MVAILASLGTLFIVAYQTHLIREQQHASALPYLTIWQQKNFDKYRLLLINDGIGPAFLEDISIMHDGVEYEMDPYDFFATKIKKEDSTITNVRYSNLRIGRVVPAGETIEVLAVLDSQTNAEKLEEWFGNGTATLKITYRSVYDQQWKVSGLANPPEQLD